MAVGCWGAVVRAGLVAVALAGALPSAWARLDLPLEVGGRVVQVFTADLDGDGRREVLVVSRSAGGGAFLATFREGAPGQWRAFEGGRLDLPEDVVALDVGPAVAAGRQSLYALTARGVWRQRLDDDAGRLAWRAEPVLSVELPHLLPSRDGPLLMDFVVGEGAGLSLLVPTLPRPTWYRRRRAADPWRRVVVDLPAAARYTNRRRQLWADMPALRLQLDVPLARLVDQDGDGRLDLVALGEDEVVVVLGGAGEGPPPVLRSRVQGPPVEPGPHRRPVQRSRSLVDVDGDGRLDVVDVAYADRGILELAGRIAVFRARAGGGFETAPDDVLVVPDGQYYGVQLLDLDGEGGSELIVPAARMGLFGLLRLLTTRRVAFSYRTYAWRGSAWDRQAVREDPLTVEMSESRRPPAVTFTDLDGDGRVDLVAGRGDDELCLYPGAAPGGGRAFAARAATCFERSPYGRVIPLGAVGGGGPALAYVDPRGASPGTVLLLRP